MPKLVSIVIPCYQYEKHIVDCLLSCVNQPYKDIEVIVVDDASKDRSVEMVERVVDERVKLIKHPHNKGYSAAKNTGIRASKGEYICTLDADDCMTPAGVLKRVRYLDEHPDVDVVHGIAYKFDGDRSYSSLLRKQHKLPFDRRCKIHAQAVMCRRRVYEKWGLYDEHMRSKADKAYWHRLEIVGAKFGKIMSKCAFYRIHPKSMLAMRNRNPEYDRKVTQQYKDRMAQIKREGLTKENTTWLS